MTAIYKKELRILFQNVIGFLFLGVTLALYGLYFFAYNLSYGTPTVSYALSGTRFLMVFTVPVLCMRALSEERKNKTDQLLFTSPVSVGKIVLAKYLALATVYSIAIAVICISPVFLSFFGTVSFAECYTAIFGFWLYGLTLIAIALFASALTESQMIAAVIGVVLLFLGYMMPSLLSLIAPEGNVITKIFGGYDLLGPCTEFLSGIFSVTGIIYYTSVSALFLFLTAQVLLKRRFTIGKKRLGTSVFSAASIALSLVVVIALNVFAGYLPDSVKSIDMTERKLYSLTETTIDFLKTVDRDIDIQVFGNESTTDELVKKTLERYQEESSFIHVSYIDPSSYPTLGSDDDSYTLSDGSLLLSDGNRSTEILSSELYESSFDYTTYSQTVTGYDGEGRITSAISYLLSEESPVVYEIEGHGELPLSSTYQSVFSKANIDLETVNLIDITEIPDDVAGVIINGATSDFSADDIKKLSDYLENGGKLLLTLHCVATEDTPNLTALLSDYGVTVVPGIVRENDAEYRYASSEFYLLPAVEASTLTQNLTSYVFMPDAAGLTYVETTAGNADNDEEASDDMENEAVSEGDAEDDTDEAEAAVRDDLTILPLLSTSDDAESVAIVEAAEGSGQMTASDEVVAEGPFTLGLTVGIGSETADLYIFGSDEMFTDAADTVVSGTNRTLFKNILNEMTAGEGEGALVSVDVKEYSNEYLTFTAGAVILYGILWGILLPILLIGVGIVIFAARRIRK